jgi:hypothetical protein
VRPNECGLSSNKRTGMTFFKLIYTACSVIGVVLPDTKYILNYAMNRTDLAFAFGDVRRGAAA